MVLKGSVVAVLLSGLVAAVLAETLVHRLDVVVVEMAVAVVNRSMGCSSRSSKADRGKTVARCSGLSFPPTLPIHTQVSCPVVDLEYVRHFP